MLLAVIAATGTGASGEASGNIQYVGGKGISHNTSASFDFASLTDGIASTPSIGDYFLIISASTATSGGAPSLPTPPAGTNTTAIVEVAGSDTNVTRLAIWEGVYEAGTSSGGTIGGPAATNSATCTQIHVFRGAQGQDVTPTTSTANNGNLPNPPSITPVSAGALLMIVGARGGTSTFTVPTGFIKERTTVRDSSTRDCVLVTGLKTDWTSGAFDPDIFGGSVGGSTESAVAATLALKPE